MSKDMTEGNPIRLILVFAIPLLLGNLFQQFYNVVDTAIVGQTLGSSALASVGSTSSVQFLIIGFCQGLCQGFAIPIAQRFGAKDYDELKRFVFNGGVWTVVMAVVITSMSVFFTPQILGILHVNQEIYANAYAYIVIIFAGIPFTLLYNYLSSILRAIGDSKTPFYFLAFSAILNIGLDLFCIIVLQMGCAGAALATIVSQAISGLLCLFYIGKKFEILHVNKENRVFNNYYTKRLLVMGIPMGLQFSIIAIGSMVMQSANNSLGTTYVSGFTAGLKLKQLMMAPFDAIGASASMFLSQNYGAWKKDRISYGFKIGVIMATAYGVIAGIIMIFAGRVLSMMFVSASEAAVLDASALYLRNMGFFFPFVGLLISLRMEIQGMGYSGTAVIGGFIEMVARSAVATVFVPMFGYTAITWTDQAAWLSGLVFMMPFGLHALKEVMTKIENQLPNYKKA